MLRSIGVPTSIVGSPAVADLFPGLVMGDSLASYEPESGYADPAGTATGFLDAARRDAARLVQGCRVIEVTVDHARVTGVDTDRGRFASPVVVDAAGAWAAEVASSVGLTVPIQPWRHETAYFGRALDDADRLPVVIDQVEELYFRPEGDGLLLVGLEAGNVVGGSPDRPLAPIRPEMVHQMIERICRRLPAMADGTYRTSHGGQDGITPDQHAILGPAGPDGFYLDCGFSGTGFKTAPAVGECLAEWILDGQPTTVDITPYTLDRFAAGHPLEGPHSYGRLWR